MPSTWPVQLEYLRMSPGRPVQNAGLDGVNHAFGLAVGGNEVIPAAGGHLFRVQLQNAVSKRIPLMMVKEQPTI